MYLQPKTNNRNSDLSVLNASQTKRRDFRTIFKEDDGATAIEFAMLGLPFLALLFGIIELAIIFFISSTTQHALETVARQIRTGEFQDGNGTASDFKAKICAEMAGLGNCANLRVDIVSSATGRFSELVLVVSPPPPPVPPAPAPTGPPTLPADVYTPTIGGDVVIVRVQYKHSLVIPSGITHLANASGNTHIITHTTAFRNEPF